MNFNLIQLKADFERAYANAVLLEADEETKRKIRDEYHLLYLQTSLREMQNSPAWYHAVPVEVKIIASVEEESTGTMVDFIGDEDEAISFVKIVANHTKKDWQLFCGNYPVKVIKYHREGN